MGDDESKFVPPQEAGDQPMPDETAKKETPEQTQADFALTPEIVEKIMEKVQDINAEGTAFTKVDSRWPMPNLETGEVKLDSIFANGIIGTHQHQPGVQRSQFTNKTNKDAYVKIIKERKHPDVFFSIVGRCALVSGSADSVEEYFFKRSDDETAFLFDLSSYKEELKRADDPLTNHTFSPYFGSSFRDSEDSFFINHNKNKKGQICTFPEFGFRLTPRIPPRYLNGVIFNRLRESEEKIPGSNKYMEETRPDYLAERATEIVKHMIAVNRDRPALLIPIYDIRGDLLWPKQMSYEEVKKFVAEREAKKAQKGDAKE